MSSPGTLLASARKASGLSVADVAAQLRLSPRQVEALEADRYGDLPGAVFVRGFIRNYARVLKLDAAPLLEAMQPALDEETPLRVRATSGTLPLEARRDHARPVVVVLCTIFVGVLIAGTYELWTRQKDERPQAIARQTSAQLVTVPQQDLPQAAPTVVVSANAVPETVQQPPAAGENVAAAPSEPASQAPAGATAAQARMGRLRVHFASDSWIEVRDREGVMYTGTGLAGTERVFEASGPMTVSIGNASGVRITYNDQPLDLSAHAARNIARVTLE